MLEFGLHKTKQKNPQPLTTTKNPYSRSHSSWVTQGQAGGKRTLNHQLQTPPSLATMSHNPIRKSIMEILKLAQFSALLLLLASCFVAASLRHP